ncbi:MAG: thiol peroxidase [Microcoleaceae cyanobacterium MO_207.B10]|nr:thiol peroxidase [Microcoleaceae cyanobacterium MO_207.B10]
MIIRETNSNVVTFYGTPITLIGWKLKLGETGRNVRLVDRNLKTVLPIAESRGKVRLLITVVSVDTQIGSTVAKKFSDAIAEFGEQIVTYIISTDLPFAQTRWCNLQQVNNMTMLSDYLDMDFARNWGLLIPEFSLLTPAVFVLDRNDTIIYREIISEITEEPNYQLVLAHLKVAITSD